MELFDYLYDEEVKDVYVKEKRKFINFKARIMLLNRG